MSIALAAAVSAACAVSASWMRFRRADEGVRADFMFAIRYSLRGAFIAYALLAFACLRGMPTEATAGNAFVAWGILFGLPVAALWLSGVLLGTLFWGRYLWRVSR